MTQRRRGWGAGLLTIAWIVTSLAGPALAQGPVKIGFVFPLTGALALGAVGSKNAAELAVADINAAGGIAALGGSRIEPVFGDSQSDPTTAAREVSNLVNRSNVTAIMDTFPSGITAVSSQAAERERVPFLAAVSYGKVLPERGFKYYFQLQVPAVVAGVYDAEILDFVNKACGGRWKRVGVIHEQTEYGTSFTEIATRKLQEAGYTVTTRIAYDAKSPDLTAQVVRLRESRPDIVLQTSYLPDSILLKETFKRLGLRVPVIESGQKIDPRYVKAVGPAVEGDFTRATWVDSVKGPLQDVARRYSQKYGTPFDSVSALVYQGVWVLKASIEKAKSTDREAVRTALASLKVPADDPHVFYRNWNGIAFDERGVNTTERFLGLQWQDRGWRVVWPTPLAETKPNCTSPLK
jgi:branched-chain amino acid transport system substrate-binding protein